MNKEVNKMMYLTDMIKREKITFNQNNLIISPNGSGKTHFIKEFVKNTKKVVILVPSVELLRDFISKHGHEITDMSNGYYFFKGNNIYSKHSNVKLVMTYDEFGKKSMTDSDNTFLDNVDYLYCDEVDFLLDDYKIKSEYPGVCLSTLENSGKLVRADTKEAIGRLEHETLSSSRNNLIFCIRHLFYNRNNQVKYYFTSDSEFTHKLKDVHESLLNDLNVLNYLNHPSIIKQ